VVAAAFALSVESGERARRERTSARAHERTLALSANAVERAELERRRAALGAG
jgi:hypothetical protein